MREDNGRHRGLEANSANTVPRSRVEKLDKLKFRILNCPGPIPSEVAPGIGDPNSDAHSPRSVLL